LSIQRLRLLLRLKQRRIYWTLSSTIGIQISRKQTFARLNAVTEKAMIEVFSCQA
jgi:hypothetical protein